jgi:hypothetical protein
MGGGSRPRQYRLRMRIGDYYGAAVCEQGHLLTAHLERRDEPIATFCTRCGGRVLTGCTVCD